MMMPSSVQERRRLSRKTLIIALMVPLALIIGAVLLQFRSMWNIGYLVAGASQAYDKPLLLPRKQRTTLSHDEQRNPSSFNRKDERASITLEDHKSVMESHQLWHLIDRQIFGNWSSPFLGERPSVRPLVFGAGRGTTATRTIYSATCALGLRSVHFALSCLPAGAHPFNVSGYIPHRQLVRNFQHFARCLEQTEDFCPDVDSWVRLMRQLLDQVISSGEIDAIHDTPYPFFPSYIIKRTVELRGIPPIILLSERDPSQWTQRRVEDHALYNSIPICNDILDANRNRTASLGGSFDVFECIERSKSSLSFHEMFSTLGNLSRDGKDDVIVHAMREYQNTLQRVASYKVNLFEKEERVSVDDLAKEMSPLLSDWRRSGKLVEKRVPFQGTQEPDIAVSPIQG